MQTISNTHIHCCCVQDTILVIPPYPYCIEEVPQDVLLERTVGMLVPSFSLPATCVQRVGDPLGIEPTALALMTSFTTWSSSVPLTSWSCLPAGRVLGWPNCMSPSQLSACMWLQLPAWWAEFHRSPCSWLVTQSLPFLTSTVNSFSCSELRLTGVARLVGPDGKWNVICDSVETCLYHVHTSILLHVHTHTWCIQIYVFMKVHESVCTMYIQIYIFINMYVHATYHYKTSCTCTYMFMNS